MSRHGRIVKCGTAELQRANTRLLDAHHDCLALSHKQLAKVESHITARTEALSALSDAVAMLDVTLAYASFLSSSTTRHPYTRPTFVTSGTSICVQQGRHPFVESLPEFGTSAESSAFRGIDCFLCQHRSLLVVTGPNMVGKTTLLKCVFTPDSHYIVFP